MRLLTLLCLLVLMPIQAKAQDPIAVDLKTVFSIPADSLAKARALGTALTGANFNTTLRSLYNNQVITFEAVVLADPFNSGLASAGANPPGRVHTWVRDVKAATDPAGMAGYTAQIVDGAWAANGLNQLAPGNVIRVTARVTYFNQQAQLTPTAAYELIALDYQAAGYPEALGQPITVRLDQLNSIGAVDATTENPQSFVNIDGIALYSQEFLRIEGLRVVRSAVQANGRPAITLQDPQTQISTYIADTSIRFRNDRIGDAGYTNAGFNVRTSPYQAPAVGAVVNVTGFGLMNTFDPDFFFNPNLYMALTPWEDDDIEVLPGAPPSVSNVSSPAGVVKGDAPVTITADVVPGDGRTLTSVALNVSEVNPATPAAQPRQFSIPMVAGANLAYSATIPTNELSDRFFYTYTVVAEDNASDRTTSPASSFRVFAGGITRISDVQQTADGNVGPSPLRGRTIGEDFEINAVVMSSPDVSGFVVIQDDEALAAWSGIFLQNAGDVAALRKGDRIRITAATVTEARVDDLQRTGNPRAGDVTALVNPTFTKTGEGAAYAYKVVPTTVLADRGVAEAHEGMMLRFENVTITNVNPDAPSDFNEFSVGSEGDATGIRLDDQSLALEATWNDEFRAGDRFSFVQGPLTFAFGNFKIFPETLEDLGTRTPTSSEGLVLPEGFVLGAIYPNPVRSSATVAFGLESAGHTVVRVYDTLGREVISLTEGFLPAGQHTASFSTNGMQAGVYFVRLSQGGASQTRSFLMIP